jgi:hypothetical protein
MGVLRQHIVRIGEALKDRAGLAVAVIGFPNTHTDADHVIRAFGTATEQSCAPDYNLLRLLEHQGHTCRVFDVTAHRGIEEYLDLNEFLPANLHQQFDLVVDSSCLEHCFNVAQAFRNLCEMTRVGGYVTTVAPIYIFNHGYYNINPIMHQDGFEANGFAVTTQELINNDGWPVGGFNAKKSDPRVRTFVLTVAQKQQQQPFKWPIQTHKGKKFY